MCDAHHTGPGVPKHKVFMGSWFTDILYDDFDIQKMVAIAKHIQDLHTQHKFGNIFARTNGSALMCSLFSKRLKIANGKCCILCMALM